MDLIDKKMNSIIKSIKIKEAKENQGDTLGINWVINSTKIGNIMVLEVTSLERKGIIRNLAISDIKGNQLRKDRMNFLYL